MQVDAADEVVRVVEAADEVREPLGRVGGEVVDVVEARAARTEPPTSAASVDAMPCDEARAVGHVVAEAAGEVVEADHAPCPEARQWSATWEPMKPAPPVTIYHVRHVVLRAIVPVRSGCCKAWSDRARRRVSPHVMGA